MKLRHIILGALLCVITTASFANRLQDARRQVVSRYVNALQDANLNDMLRLFTPNAYVVSTSRGQVGARDFFSSFLPKINYAQTEMHEVFDESDRFIARFHLSETMRSGESGEGEYIDEFIFAEGSTKLAAVYMFENTKFFPRN